MVEQTVRIIKSIVFILLMFVGLYLKPANAEGLTLISDAETQNYLAKIVKPLFNAAGVRFDANNIFIVNDNSLNAFVSDGNYLFVHTGTIVQAENTNELAGILAHETGHILGGHIVRLKLKMEKMQYVMLGSALAAGAAAISTGRGDAAMAVILGSQTSALNSILHYQVQEERSADESAIKLLDKTKQSTNGLLSFMKKIKKQNTLSGIEEDSYFRTHPLTAERISHFEVASKGNHYSEKSPYDSEFLLVKAKLTAFLADKNKTMRLYPSSNNSAPARYARSILAFKQGKISQALSLIDGLISEQPKNPYFYELKGQFLFESGKVKESVSAYQKALDLLPGNYLLQISLAHSLLESDESSQNVQKAITLLQKSLITYDSSMAWQLLAQAYDRAGKKAAAHYATAEFNYMIGNPETALKQLEFADKNSPDKSLKLKINDLKQKIKDDEDI